jgi:hypothetical protein
VKSLSSHRKVGLAKRTSLMMWCTMQFCDRPTTSQSRSQHKVTKSNENPENDPIEVEGILNSPTQIFFRGIISLGFLD